MLPPVLLDYKTPTLPDRLGFYPEPPIWIVPNIQWVVPLWRHIVVCGSAVGRGRGQVVQGTVQEGGCVDHLLHIVGSVSRVFAVASGTKQREVCSERELGAAGKHTESTGQNWCLTITEHCTEKREKKSTTCNAAIVCGLWWFWLLTALFTPVSHTKQQLYKL